MTLLSAIMLVLLSSHQAMILMKVLTFVFFLPGTVLLFSSQIYLTYRYVMLILPVYIHIS